MGLRLKIGPTPNVGLLSAETPFTAPDPIGANNFITILFSRQLSRLVIGAPDIDDGLTPIIA